jgi:ABC-type hemin transport system substrate-binding protein
MDKNTVIKLLAGTMARGILWAAGAVSAKLGIESLSQDAAQSVAFFAASIVVTAAASWWSSHKDQRLLMTPPPSATPGGSKSEQPRTPEELAR